MSAVITSPEMIVNAALGRIGKMQRIGSMQEGSAPAKIALDNYGQVRDKLLREGNWGFARGDVALALLKTAPVSYVGVTWSSTYPPLPWRYEYTYPADCLKVRALRGTPPFIPTFDPHPEVFDTPNDNSYTPAVKVIVCNVPNAIATYTRQVTNPADWEQTFVDAMIEAMGEVLAAGLAPTPQAEQMAAAKEPIAVAVASVTQG